MPRTCLSLAAAIGLLVPSLAFAQVQQTREQKVRRDKQELQENDHWIYNDYAQARAEARKTGKPILAVIRCIP